MSWIKKTGRLGTANPANDPAQRVHSEPAFRIQFRAWTVRGAAQAQV